MSEVVWRAAHGFPDYAVSVTGLIRRVTPNWRSTGGALRPWIGNHGYLVVGLMRDGKCHRRLVHRLVCEAFHGQAPTTLHQVAHNDGSRRNNWADNLRWATRSENMADCVAHGTDRRGKPNPMQNPARGERHGRSTLREADVLAIRLADKTGRALAAEFGVSPATISLIRSRTIWSHV